MPIYEYTCTSCRHDFEALVRGDEQAACPDCQSTQLAKRLSVPAAPATSGQLPTCEAPASAGCGMGRCGLPECGS